VTNNERALQGRIGGLTAWSRNDSETMVGAAHLGFRRRFEKMVDPDRVLPEPERLVRADRARRAHMLTLAAKSAESRRRKAAPAIETSGTAVEVRRDRGERPAAA